MSSNLTSICLDESPIVVATLYSVADMHGACVGWGGHHTNRMT